MLRVLCLLRRIHHEHMALSLISQTSRIFVCIFVSMCVCVCVIFGYLNFYLIDINSFQKSFSLLCLRVCASSACAKKTDRIAILYLSIHVPTTRTHQIIETARSTAPYTAMHVCPESANAELLWGRWGNGQTTAQGGGGSGALL